MAVLAVAFEHGTSAKTVIVGRQSTEGRNNLDTAIKAVAHGDRNRRWGCNQVVHTKRECTKKPAEIKRRSL